MVIHVNEKDTEDTVESRGGKKEEIEFISAQLLKTPQNPKEVSQMARILSMFLAEEIQYVIQA